MEINFKNSDSKVGTLNAGQAFISNESRGGQKTVYIVVDGKACYFNKSCLCLGEKLAVNLRTGHVRKFDYDYPVELLHGATISI